MKKKEPIGIDNDPEEKKRHHNHSADKSYCELNDKYQNNAIVDFLLVNIVIDLERCDEFGIVTIEYCCKRSEANDALQNVENSKRD